jgi:hypothetical protein
VYATVSLTLDVGKRNGSSAYKRQNPAIKKVLRCYTSDKHVKPRVISNAAVELSQLVKCLQTYGKEWPDKVKEDFCIGYATYIQECSDEKLDTIRPEQEDLPEDDDGSTIDSKEVARGFFDVGRVLDRGELEQAARVLQRTFELEEAPGIDILQIIRDWQRQTGPPVQSGSRCSSAVETNSQSPSPEPEPVQSGQDVDMEERMDSIWDGVMISNITREVEEILRLFGR